MSVSRIEDLPNELWLEVLVYFTWSELNKTWYQWKLNSRIEMLVEVARNGVALSLSSMMFKRSNQCLDYLSFEHPLIADRITSLLLNESSVSSEILSHWVKNGSYYFPRLRECIVYMDLIDRCTRWDVVRLIDQHASILRRIVFYFNGFDRYYSIMRMFIKQGISLHTMEFIIIKENTYFPWYGSLFESDNNSSNQIFEFSKTVRLRLSFQYQSELLFLMQNERLPCLKDLDLTMENGFYKLNESHNGYENESCFRLSPNDFLNQSESILINLRILKLRQIDLINVIVLIEHVKSMNQLQSLILVNCHGQNKDELIQFRNSIQKVLIRLRRLEFVLYLPVETKLEKIDFDWFNLNHDNVQYEINEFMMILYTVPYLLNNQRKVSNDTFLRQSPKNNQINHIQWRIDRNLLSFDRSLIHFQYVNSLFLFIDIKEINMNVNSWNVSLPVLRHLRIDFYVDSVECLKSSDRYLAMNDDYRYFILQQFRLCASTVESLTLYWSNIRLLLKRSSPPWSFVRQLNILMKSCSKIPSPSWIKQLPTDKAFPNLEYLSFGGRRFPLYQTKSFVLRILLCFDALVSSSSKFIILHLNRGCTYHRTLPWSSRQTLLTILTQYVRSRSELCSSAKIILDSNEEIIIWL